MPVAVNLRNARLLNVDISYIRYEAKNPGAIPDFLQFFCYSSLVNRCHDKFVLAQRLIMTAAGEGSAGL